MRLLDERSQIKATISHWLEYLPQWLPSPTHAIQLAAFQKLNPETATTEDVAKAKEGFASIEKNTCGECGVEDWDIVEIGEPPNYESWTAYLCLDCLEKAVTLLREHKRKQNEGEVCL